MLMDYKELKYVWMNNNVIVYVGRFMWYEKCKMKLF